MKLVKEALGIDAAMPLTAAVAEANGMMGLAGTGPLPQQIEALLSSLGLAVEAATAAPARR